VTQEELAEMSGLSVRTVRNLEHGRSRPYKRSVRLLADALKLDGAAREEFVAAPMWRQPARLPAMTTAAERVRTGHRPPLTGRRSGTEAPAEPVRPVVEVFPVAIGQYADPGLVGLDAKTRAGRLVDLLAPFGGQHQPWAHPARERGADAVQHRLRAWSRTRSRAAHNAHSADPAVSGLARASVLYWVGHGWSDGTRTALAHAKSPAAVGESGLEPQQLAQAIRARQLAAQACGQAGQVEGWALVVIDTSHATAIADAVMAALHGPDAPGRLLLIAVPDAAVPAGGFPSVLAGLLEATFQAEPEILLRDLAGELERVLGPGSVYQRGLGDAALVRTWPPVASWMSAPVDTIRHLEDVLAGLPRDERSHFVAKAQGAEHGELCWFFEGRQHETAQISAWLQQADSGILVVTGRAGAGKSALLGHVLVLSLPDLRDALARRGLITLPPPATLPPGDVFDVVIHLSGLTLAQATGRVAAAAGLGRLPSVADPALGVANDLDWLAGQLPTVPANRGRPLTILVDALDEAIDPLDTARSLLARIAALPGVRVLAGTRASTHETPDTPARDHNLLTALGAGPDSPGLDPSAVAGIVPVTRDPGAITRYVAGRLRHARGHGTAGHAIPGMAQVRDADIDLAAAAVAARYREFLYAHLAVYELIADPTLLRPGRAMSLESLLRGDHQDLFAAALDRLVRLDDHYVPLIQALALARGRGVPEADGIWATIAASLIPPRASGAAAAETGQGWAHAIHGLLWQAAAYITVDTAVGAAGQSTVYRLAHRTFTEYFTRTSRDIEIHRGRRRLAAMAMLDRARQVAAANLAAMPAYLARHLSGHVADAGLWDDLAAAPRVLDGLDPTMVTADALRTLFGRRAIPPPVAGVIGARDELLSAAAIDRAGLRQFASTTHTPYGVTDEPCHDWGIAAAQAGRVSMHIRLSGHTAAAAGVCAVPLPDGRIVVASASDDGTIRLWDLNTATPAGAPLAGHTGTVEYVCAVPLPGLKIVLASASSDGTVRLWDPVTGRPVGSPLAGHIGSLTGVCAVPGADGSGHRDGRSWIASAGDDGTVRVWDPVTGEPVGQPLTGHTGIVTGVCAVPGADGSGHRDGRSWIASAGGDGTVRVWDPVTGEPVGSPLAGHTGIVFGVCAVAGADGLDHRDGRSWIASAGADGTVRVWDPLIGRRAAQPLTRHNGILTGLCTMPGADRSGHRDGRSWIASAGADGTVRVWDPLTGHPVGSPLAGHTGRVARVCAVPGADRSGHRDGRSWIASAGDDGTVRVWDPVTGSLVGSPLAGHTGRVIGVCAVPGADRSGHRDGRSWIASAGADGTVRVWDPVTGHPVGSPLAGHTGRVIGVCTVAGADGSGHRDGRSWIASAGADGTVRVWDLITGHPVGSPLAGHTGSVTGLCAVPGADGPGNRDGRSWIASAGADGTVRVWDPVTGHPVGSPLAGHTGIVTGVCAVPGADRSGHRDGRSWIASAGLDGTVRLWDPVTGYPVGSPLTGHTGSVTGVCVVAGAWIASAGADGTVRVWDPVTGRPVGQPMSAALPPVAALQPLGVPGAGCAVLHSAGHLHVWDPATATLTPMTASARHISAFAELTTPGRQRVITDTTGQVTLRTLSQADPSRTTHLADDILCLLPAPGQPAQLACASRDGTITLLDTATLDPSEPPLSGHTGPVRTLCLLPGPAGPVILASAGNDATIRLWDLTRRTPLGKPLTGHTGWIWSLTAIPVPGQHTSLLASAGADATIRIWDTRTGQATLPPLEGHTDQVRSVTCATAADGSTLLVSGGHDGTVRLWDPATGQPIHTIPLGISVHALLPQPPGERSRKRTHGGATITVGLRTGILSLDLSRSMFPAR
jgi:WD40 repeat protein